MARYASNVLPLKSGAKGPAVKDLQKAVNRILSAHKMGWMKVQTDGDLGPLTLKRVGFAAWLIGLERRFTRQAQKGHVSTDLQLLLRREKRRSAKDLRRKVKRHPKIRKIRKLHSRIPKVTDGLMTFDGKPVSATVGWWLQKSRDAGWNGVLLSGYRDPAYSEQLCYAMCGAPTCPGRCAGRGSGHSQKGGTRSAPQGCADVTDHATFAAVQVRIGSPLKNLLGPADPNHFSLSGR